MKKFFVLLTVAVTALCASAQDYNVAYHYLCMRKIIKEWHDQNLYTNMRVESYWRCDDGGVLVGVLVQGAEYFCDDDDLPPPEVVNDEDYDPDYSIADMMFFKIGKGEVMWWAKTPKQMCGRDFNFNDYIVHLPQKGKDITLDREVLVNDEFVQVPAYVLHFNGSTFDVITK